MYVEMSVPYSTRELGPKVIPMNVL